jgi:uncharacterized membrane protein YgdD (TMEM256/DUF423 family)
MHKTFLKTGISIGILSVLSGAFAAHSLKNNVSDYALGIFETAVRYQFYHAFALILTGILFKEFPRAVMKWAGNFFIVGIILFSGSLYVLAVIKGAVIPGYNWIGAITPFGGLCFILGWICLFIGVSRKAGP